MVDLTELTEVLADVRDRHRFLATHPVLRCSCGEPGDIRWHAEHVDERRAAALEEVLVAHYEAGLVEGSMIGDPDVAEVRERDL